MSFNSRSRFIFLRLITHVYMGNQMSLTPHPVWELPINLRNMVLMEDPS